MKRCTIFKSYLVGIIFITLTMISLNCMSQSTQEKEKDTDKIKLIEKENFETKNKKQENIKK